MSIAGDSWSDFGKRLNICAICATPMHPPDQSGKNSFSSCDNCGALLLFDSLGRLEYSIPDSTERFLKENRVYTSIPKRLLKLMPESVARENHALPLATRNGVLIVGIVQPMIDTLEKIRFILGQDVLAAKITDDCFRKLIGSYDPPN